MCFCNRLFGTTENFLLLTSMQEKYLKHFKIQTDRKKESLQEMKWGFLLLCESTFLYHAVLI